MGWVLPRCTSVWEKGVCGTRLTSARQSKDDGRFNGLPQQASCFNFVSHSVWQTFSKKLFLDGKAFMCYFFHIFIQLPFHFCFDFYPCLTFGVRFWCLITLIIQPFILFLPSPRRVANWGPPSPSQRSLALRALKKNA